MREKSGGKRERSVGGGAMEKETRGGGGCRIIEREGCE